MNIETELKEFLTNYNNAWYEKDIDKLKKFYDEKNNDLIYFDNHKNNDTFTVETHLKLVSNFFKNGKDTESGDVEPLIIENLNIFSNKASACLCYNARYKSYPTPAVRTTMYLQKQDNIWKILHVHCSFEP